MAKPRAPNRSLRLADQMQSDLALWLQRADDPTLKRGGMVSVTEVQLNRDMSQAKVFFSVLYTEHATIIQTQLNQMAPMIRSHLARQITLYRMPALLFEYDQTEARADEINRLLKSITPSAPD